jgi:NAD(P)-dependent dehydrogenase (short-subunit alcohol dehydrogenase family)
MTSSLGLTKDGIETVFQVNHLGHFYLTHLLLDMIVHSNGRVVNVSSYGHHLCTDPTCFGDVQSAMTGTKARYVLYSRSKLANILFIRELQKRLKARHEGFQGDVFAVSPGRVYTSAWGKMTPKWLKPFFWVLGKLTMSTPLEGATTTVFCAIAPTLQGRGGAYLAGCAVKEPSELARDDDLAGRLWRGSETLLGIQFL